MPNTPANKLSEMDHLKFHLKVREAADRILGRALAMRHTSELQDVINTVGEQLQSLELDITGGVFISINDEIDRDLYVWGSGGTAHYGQRVRVPFYNRPIFTGMINHIKNGSGLFLESFTRNQKTGFFKHLFKYPPYNETTKAHQKEVLSREGGYTRAIYTSALTSVFIINHHGRQFSEKDHQVLIRFAEVFEQGYRRFLDLQKAEAQAREAQIEAALERVRSASMAMHKSEDLNQVIATIFHQLQSLGFEAVQCEIALFDPITNDCEIWPSNEIENVLPRSYRIPYTERAFYQVLLNAWKSKTDYNPYQLKGRIKSTYEKWLFTQTDWKDIPQSVQDSMQEIKLVNLYWATTKHGILEVGGEELIPAENFAIIKRFANVFEQSYTRFLDIKKAEAQAREARIEVALERVRTKTMAMQKSDELKEVIQLVYEQFVHLNIFIEHTGFIMDYKDREDMLIWLADPKGVPALVSIPYFDSPHWNSFIEASEKGTNFFANHLTFEEKNKFYKQLFTYIPGIPEKVKKQYLGCPGLAISTVLMDNVGLYIENFSGSPYSDEENDTLLRFGKVFQQTYTRFLDLQKAEAQAREAQIEAALERIRAKSMAMHQSHNLRDVVQVMYKQLEILGLAWEGISIVLCHEEKDELEYWFADVMGLEHLSGYLIKGRKNYYIRKFWSFWKNGVTGKIQLEGDKKWRYDTYLLEETDFKTAPEELKQAMRREKSVCFTIVPFKYGFLEAVDTQQLRAPEVFLLGRFAMVFEQAYSRFLDLQRAEAQAREAQIVASLERVRAASMAMHDSDELSDVLSILFEQYDVLQINPSHAVLTLIDQENNTMKFRMTGRYGHRVMAEQEIDLKALDSWVDINEKWIKSKPNSVNINEYPAEVLPQIWKLYHEILSSIPEHVRPGVEDFPNGLFITEGYCQFGYIGFAHNRKPTQEEKDIVVRFATEFGSLYQRFLDLQKAEAQAREAEIEVALERVRAASMAMHKTDELKGVIRIIFEQLALLNINAEHAGIVVDYKPKHDWNLWVADKQDIPSRLTIPYLDSIWDRQFTEAKKKGRDFYATLLNFEEKNSFYEKLLNYVPELTKEARDFYLSCPGLAGSTVIQDDIGLYIENFAGIPYSDEDNDILKRFGRVFQQAYTRFLDLQKVEAQTREARIESALERVRSKAMAMRSSEDLASTVDTFFSELNALGVMPRRCGVGIVDAESRLVDIHATTATEDDEVKKMTGNLTLTGHPVLESIYDNWIDQKEYHPVLKGNEISAYYQAMNPEVTFPDFADDVIQYGYYFFFKEGGVFAWTDKEFDESELQIFRRYNSVLSLTYRRYIDLVESEAREREAIKESSLDRIRAEIASMRSKVDLQRITPLVWRELTTLEVPFFRCGVFIIDEEEKVVNVYLSAPDGHSLGVMHLSFDANPLTKNAVESWRKKEVYTAHWDKKAFNSWMQTMSEQGQIKDQQTYQGADSAPESLDLHFIPFKQGMLYVGNSEPLQKEKIELVDALAKAFSIAYARYEDFNKIEQAKLQVEKTLVDLKQAQSQLVQSEKMASLGELTAGIAHEIQNPLNFVNNFSEVSKELMEEMLEEMKNGDEEEVNAIASDIIQNLEKILHHGKRADGIVKGMLQHSRSSSGEKELIEINALADEYLRLAYHGLRAKDKTFNATMETDFDPSIGKMSVVPQDTGRVLLNLITNAFHAVQERNKLGDNGDYKPTVSVTIKKTSPFQGGSEGVQITVSDNGSGIPDDIKDKIFQPFFTTKPTGEGTGLGLSLSYDIVKAHGGEIKVESIKDKGTRFFVTLPVV